MHRMLISILFRTQIYAYYEHNPSAESLRSGFVPRDTGDVGQAYGMVLPVRGWDLHETFRRTQAFQVPPAFRAWYQDGNTWRRQDHTLSGEGLPALCDGGQWHYENYTGYFPPPSRRKDQREEEQGAHCGWLRGSCPDKKLLSFWKGNVTRISMGPGSCQEGPSLACGKFHAEGPRRDPFQTT